MTSTAIDFPNNRSQLDPTLNNPPFTDIPLENGDVFIAAGSSYTWAQDTGEAYGRWKNEDPGATGDGRYVRLQDDGSTQVINGGGVLSINDNIFLNGSTGDINPSGTVDGRDVAADGTKLDGIEAGADVSQWSDVTGGINYADGNVGIGTDNMQAKLDVNGTIKSNNVTFFLQPEILTNYTTITNGEGVETSVYTGPTLNVKEVIQSLVSRCDDRDAQIAALTTRIAQLELPGTPEPEPEPEPTPVVPHNLIPDEWTQEQRMAAMSELLQEYQANRD